MPAVRPRTDRCHVETPPQALAEELAVHRKQPTQEWVGRLEGPVRVKRVGFVMSAICPVYPKQQTFLGPVGTSHLARRRSRRMCFILVLAGAPWKGRTARRLRG